ncbi:tRNA (adenine22-N1)-methyltransferase [Butyrivibrio fibrisolvens DSM 3071]|uniref:tRNA (Adenine22-N1)-methyltransferase n=2 Tax=Butyrivibrio fibrisolvens TaxID=831 RepID=A0A1M5YIZ8_BUTFI|nr:tRNA (adenine22-N1)-methyltransferase [Butyrivibrio fibrisolvens DSM 3071]
MILHQLELYYSEMVTNMDKNELDNNKLPALSKRLQTVADMVEPGSKVADVGTDHGFVPIYLAKAGLASHAIAMDVRKGPLERATQHVKEYKLEDVIETRLSDGLEKLLEGEADTMICAGMGGPLMQKILENKDPRSVKLKTLILEPQSELMQFRIFLREKGYEIVQEEFLLEDGKYYPVIKTCVNDEIFSENLPRVYLNAIDKLKQILDSKKENYTDFQLLRICDRFGPCILTSPNADFKSFLVHEKAVCDTILGKISDVKDSHIKRAEQISLERSDINIALHLFDL